MASSRPRVPGPKERASRALVDLLSTSPRPPDVEEIRAAFPKRWDIYGDLVLFSEASFAPISIFRDHFSSAAFWGEIAAAFGVSRVALRGAITQDDFRTSGARLVLGGSGIVQNKDNGVIYQWDITRCMFSRGNITEKLRIGGWDCRNEVVVDLYAGIGYFTLPYIVKAKARHVHACEWNPEAVAALRTNLQLNKVPDSVVTIHAGDNRLLCPPRVAQRVNLGLLPTARPSWPVAALALDPSTGGWLHVHENVTSKVGESKTPADSAQISSNSRLRSAWIEFSRELEIELAKVFASEDPGRRWTTETRHIQFVKSYAPHIDHIVCDVLCRVVDSG